MTNNPQRISRILSKIQKLWETDPNMELGQILTILQRRYLTDKKDMQPPPPMLFYFTDFDLENEIDKIFENE